MPKQTLRQADWGQQGGGWVSWAAGWGPVGQLGGCRTPAGVPLLPYTPESTPPHPVSEDTQSSDLPLPKGASIFGGGQPAVVLGACRLGGDCPPWSPPAYNLSEAGSPQPFEGHIPPTSPTAGAQEATCPQTGDSCGLWWLSTPLEEDS